MSKKEEPAGCVMHVVLGCFWTFIIALPILLMAGVPESEELKDKLYTTVFLASGFVYCFIAYGVPWFRARVERTERAHEDARQRDEADRRHETQRLRQQEQDRRADEAGARQEAEQRRRIVARADCE